jgi:pimeloyl-ACP methyl ester carboxylesterase
MKRMQPFRIAIPDAALDDLHRRLDATRWPAGVTDHGGIALDAMQELVRHWRHDFDWRRHERELNDWPQFRAGDLHVVHLVSDRADATPLLLLHGWPGSFVEMRRVVPLLRARFHLVIPSLPGYGFSPLPPSGAFSHGRIADVMLELMTTLGYERFGVQGGDWGASVGTWMSLKAPRRVIGLHLNYIPGSYTPHVTDEPTSEEREFLEARDGWLADSGGYHHIQATRPLTLGYALTDSPAGLAAWIHEKFLEWADPETLPPLDDILTNIAVYWFTHSIAPSMRLYLEAPRTALRFAEGQRVDVPAAILRCRLEAPFPPRSWVERGFTVARWTEVPRGGHFAAMEVPDVLAADVTSFFG